MMQSERQDSCLKKLNRFKREIWESGNSLDILKLETKEISFKTDMALKYL